MYTRFYNSLINPRNIVEFRNDSLFRVILYILFFALLLSTRPIINVMTFDGVNEATKELIIADVKDINETCAIENSVLVCESKEMTLVYETSLVSLYTDSFDNWNPSVYQDIAYNFVIHKDLLHVVVSGQDVTSFPLTEMPEEFRNFDFQVYEENQTDFYTVVFNALDDYMLNTKVIWGTILILMDFLGNVVMFLLFILLSTWMLRMRFREIKFKQLFTMTAYSSTALYVILIINSLYNLSFFIVLILLFVAIRQNSQLSMELYRRLTKKP